MINAICYIVSVAQNGADLVVIGHDGDGDVKR